MTPISDDEWQRWLHDFSDPSNLSHDPDIHFDASGGPDGEQSQLGTLQLLRAGSDQHSGKPTINTSVWLLEDEREPEHGTKPVCASTPSYDDLYLLVQKLQRNLQVQTKTVERLTTYIAKLQPWTIEISTHLQQLMTKDDPGSAITSSLKSLWLQEASKPNFQPSEQEKWQVFI